MLELLLVDEVKLQGIWIVSRVGNRTKVFTYALGFNEMIDKGT